MNGLLKRVLYFTVFVVVSWMVASCYTNFLPSKTTDFAQPQNAKKLIVAWTKASGDYIFNDYLNCSSTEVENDCECMELREYERSNLTADAIIFYDVDLLSHHLPKSRLPHQNFVYFNWESPKLSTVHEKKIPNDYFNTTMSYRRDSDYYYPYGSIPTQNQSTYEEIKTSLDRRTKSTFAMISNCHPYSNRDQVISELFRGHNITYFGRCSPTKQRCNETCMKNNLETHRFFLAFENSLCNDYVTEKFFRTIENRLVPVVLKRQFYDVSLIPPGSFVAVDDFKSIKELAEYLNEAQRNDSLYMSHFEWIKTWRNEAKPANPLRQLCDDLLKRDEYPRLDLLQFYYKDQCLE